MPWKATMLIADSPIDSAPDWVGNRCRLWSLSDMWRIDIANLAAVFGKIYTVQQQLALLAATGVGAEKTTRASAELIDVTLDGVEQALVGIGAHINVLKMSDVITKQHQDLLKRFAEQRVAGKITDDIRVRFDVLASSVLIELTGAYCLIIPAVQREFYEQKETPFGAEVADKFPDAVIDIRAASRCIALDEWTAAVFHLMAVLEIGLRSLTRKLGIKMTRSGKAIDHAQWSALLSDIQTKIKERRNPQQGKKLAAAMSRRLDWYDEMAAHFSNCNAAWRIHVSHVRGKYDQRAADEIWSHVRAFMQLLARGPS